MKLRIVIVNYKTTDMVIDCLRALAPQLTAGQIEAVVTDNASPDDSLARLKQAVTEHHWQRVVSILPLQRNGGFAFGNNAGIRPALSSDNPPAYILLLNPDTVPRPDAIEQLLTFMEAHPTVGIAGSRLEDPDGTPQRSAFRFHSLASEFENAMRFGVLSRALAQRLVAPSPPAHATATDWVAGASMIIRRQVFDVIGLLDENYFMYFEEVDFCKRAADAGFTCWYVPQSRVVHLVGQASGVTVKDQRPKRRPAYWFQSRSRYFTVHHGRFKKRLIDLAWILGFALFKLRAAVQRKPHNDPPYLLRDFIRYSLLSHAD